MVKEERNIHNSIGTPELLRRKGLKVSMVEGRYRARRSKISPIHTMYERGILTISQFSAGKRLYELFIEAWGAKGGYEIRERVDGGANAPEITTGQINAIHQLRTARKVARNDWVLIEQVCIDEKPLTRRGMGGYERKVLICEFRRGLNRIAEIYHFK